MQAVWESVDLQLAVAAFASIESWRAIGLLNKEINGSMQMQAHARRVNHFVKKLYIHAVKRSLPMTSREMVNGIINRDVAVAAELYLLQSDLMQGFIFDDVYGDDAKVLQVLDNLEPLLHDVNTPRNELWAMVHETVGDCRRHLSCHKNIIFRSVYSQITGTLYANATAFDEYRKHGKITVKCICTAIEMYGGTQEYLEQIAEWVPFGCEVLCSRDESELATLLESATAGICVDAVVVMKILTHIRMHRTLEDVRFMQGLYKKLSDFVNMGRRQLFNMK